MVMARSAAIAEAIDVIIAITPSGHLEFESTLRTFKGKVLLTPEEYIPSLQREIFEFLKSRLGEDPAAMSEWQRKAAEYFTRAVRKSK